MRCRVWSCVRSQQWAKLSRWATTSLKTSATWMKYETLVAVVDRATAVRVVQGAAVDWRRSKLTPDVIGVDHQDDIVALVEALRYDGPVANVEWMQWSALTFGFVAVDRQVLTELSYLQPGWLRHATWPGDQPLSDPQRVEAWLAAHGWTSTTG